MGLKIITRDESKTIHAREIDKPYAAQEYFINAYKDDKLYAQVVFNHIESIWLLRKSCSTASIDSRYFKTLKELIEWDGYKDLTFIAHHTTYGGRN